MMEEMIEIRKSELDRLRERDDWLSCLEAAGLDNWDGMDLAHEIHEASQ
ncbi:hypothetical protein [Microbulbifer discodermiae]